jgi:hypothetical protein
MSNKEAVMKALEALTKDLRALKDDSSKEADAKRLALMKGLPQRVEKKRKELTGPDAAIQLSREMELGSEYHCNYCDHRHEGVHCVGV